MGNYLSFLFSKLVSSDPARVCMVGLDGAGKTTILYKLKFGEVVTTIPTIGFNVDTLTVKNLTMTVWDVGGQKKIRALWRYYFENNDAVVFVVDSADRDRFQDAAEELISLFREDQLRHSAVLILANKQDSHLAASPAEIVSAFGLDKQRGPRWHVQGCCAHTGDGLLEGFEWLADAVRENKKRRT